MTTSHEENDDSPFAIQNPGHTQLEPFLNLVESNVCFQDPEYIENIKKVHTYLEEVKTIVRPGCSQEVLNAVASGMSSLVENLLVMSSKPKLHSSL